jgi:hypothetical protein
MDKENGNRKRSTKAESNREDTKRRAQAKKITKTAKVRVLGILERSGFKKKKNRGKIGD